jgi:hypothetical protein
MKNKKSRLVGIGILALILSVTVGLVSGSVADAKKKKKTTKSFTITKTTPTAIPLASTPTTTSYIKIPIGSISGKKYKGKIISFRGISVTTTFTGDAGFANGIGATLIGPTGRTANISSPFSNKFPSPTETSSGPTTETPNSPTQTCTPQTPSPPPPCANPDATLGPPYAGTIGNIALLAESGVSPVGTWTLRVFNTSNTLHATLNSITVTGDLVKSLPTS